MGKVPAWISDMEDETFLHRVMYAKNSVEEQPPEEPKAKKVTYVHRKMDEPVARPKGDK